ncbi:MAG: bifunctional nuclease family protein [Anaerolineae bacterium]|nr:bifunctional nuclease family protein [Anaerolineae bacterium]
MIEVEITGIQVNLMSQHRVVLLREVGGNRYLTIWIGPFEAEAINVRLQEVEFARPLTHDLLKNTIEALGGVIQYIIVTDLQNDTFYGRIVVSVDGRELEIDSRPSDAMALAVRAAVPIYVAEEVMDTAGIVPEQDLIAGEAIERESSAFDDFLKNLDIDDLPIH